MKIANLISLLGKGKLAKLGSIAALLSPVVTNLLSPAAANDTEKEFWTKQLKACTKAKIALKKILIIVAIVASIIALLLIILLVLLINQLAT